MTKTAKVLVLCLLGMNIFLWSVLGATFFNKLEYKESHAYIPHQETLTPQLTNDEAVKIINNLVNKSFKIEYVSDVDFDGQVSMFAIFDNTIRINNAIANNSARFVWTYAHEVTHATKFCLDERKTQYYTFVLLYESGNKYLQDVALFNASNMINNTYKEYDATYYIVEYLQKTA